MIEKVKVGGITYNVSIKDIVEINQDRNYFGRCDFMNSEIQVLNTPNKERQEQVFVHELAHAIMYESGITNEMDSEQEEELTNRIGLVLHQVLKDNDMSFLRNINTERE